MKSNNKSKTKVDPHTAADGTTKVVSFEDDPTLFDSTYEHQQPGINRVHFRDEDKLAKKNRIAISEPLNYAWDYEYQWHAGLSQCCTDLAQCCYAWFCPCCFVSSHLTIDTNFKFLEVTVFIFQAGAIVHAHG
jgi:hypothetical protein